ncbi:MAG: radical SAM protein, partial [Coriobacteriales bacterium]
MKSTESLRRKTEEYAVGEIMGILAGDPEKHIRRLVDLAQHLAIHPEHKQAVATVKAYVDQQLDGDLPAPLRTLARGLRQSSPACRTKLAMNALVNGTWNARATRDRILEEQGFYPPSIMLMSPSMRCNLSCSGCYAAQYTKKDDLPYEVMDRVLREAKELGIFSVILLGGEPLVRPDVVDLIEEHDDMAFMVFTNGTLITPALAERFSAMGNAVFSVSIDGLKRQHEARRGVGTFDRTIQGLRSLREAGVPYGFSTMVTRENCEDVIADEFNDFLVEEGCLWGWHFLYMPVGRDADPSLMPTPEQREMLRQRGAQYIRSRKELFVIDFWNDAPYVGGCIAGARRYFHINANGDVEPCIFAHFATHNIKDVSLAEALSSPFFSDIKSRQPYDDNLLRP